MDAMKKESFQNLFAEYAIRLQVKLLRTCIRSISDIFGSGGTRICHRCSQKVLTNGVAKTDIRDNFV